jgi:hypothetical protein
VRAGLFAAVRLVDGAGVARARRALGGASAHSLLPSSRVQATWRRLVGALRVGSLRCGPLSSVSSRLRETSRAPRLATLPHCLALPGRGCSSSKASRPGRGGLPVAAPRAGGRRVPRSGRSSRRVLGLPVPVPVPLPLRVPVRSRRSSPSRRGGRLPPVRPADDAVRDWYPDWLRLPVPDGRPARDDVLDERPDDDPLRVPPLRPRSLPELDPLGRLGPELVRPPELLDLDPVDRLGPPPARPPLPPALGRPGRPARLEPPARAEPLPWLALLRPAWLGRLGRAEEARRFGRGVCAGIRGILGVGLFGGGQSVVSVAWRCQRSADVLKTTKSPRARAQRGLRQ